MSRILRPGPYSLGGTASVSGATLSNRHLISQPDAKYLISPIAPRATQCDRFFKLGSRKLVLREMEPEQATRLLSNPVTASAVDCSRGTVPNTSSLILVDM